MPGSRFPDYVRRIRDRRIHNAALTLALALLIGLACDESPTTETRTPAAEGEPGEDGVVPFDGGPASVIGLPVNQSVTTTAPAPAFRINQFGTGPNGIFQISRSASTQTALEARTNGRGRAGFFRTTNTANTEPALMAQSNGLGAAVFASTTNTANTLPALQAQSNGSGGAVVASTLGPQAIAGQFENLNESNPSTALSVSTQGTGHALVVTNFGGGAGTAGLFSMVDVTSEARTLEAHGNHRGGVFAAFQNGIGHGGRFEIASPSGPGTALTVETKGTGLALLVSRGASVFNGTVTVNGTLTKSAGSFRIDHPLDPQRKYLSHSFVESPDMKNVYDGTATLDENGRATVELPEYFEALNRDFRYQLTAIGAPGPNLYIAEGVKQNRFKIAGGRRYASVSWMITGIRQDPYANEHRIKVEEEKPGAEGELVARH